MRGPEFDQQAVKVLPLLINSFLDLFWEGGNRADGDMLEVSGSDGSECCSDPLNAQFLPRKLQMFEFGGFGEVV